MLNFSHAGLGRGLAPSSWRAAPLNGVAGVASPIPSFFLLLSDKMCACVDIEPDLYQMALSEAGVWSQHSFVRMMMMMMMMMMMNH